MLTHHAVAGGCARAKQDIHATPGDVETPSITDVLPGLLNSLVEADLSAAGYRVVLDTLARLMARGVTTEAVPAEWMAERLNLSRNTIGAAYQAAEAAGLLRRIPVAERGAPTRTTLQGALLRVIDIARTGTKPTARVTRHYRRPGVSDQRRAAPLVNSAGDTARGGLVSSTSDPAPVRIFATTQGIRVEQVVHVDHPPKEGPEVEGNKPKLTPAEMQHALASVPMDARRMATLARGPKDFVIDPAWHLTEIQIDALRMLLPKPEDLRPRPNCVPRTQTGGEIAPWAVVNAIRSAMPRLEALVGKGSAPTVADEIVFQVTQKLLGNGDHVGGVRAGLSLVAQGRWRTPRGFSQAWVGVVDRSWMQMQADREAPRNLGDAQKTVH